MPQPLSAQSASRVNGNSIFYIIKVNYTNLIRFNNRRKMIMSMLKMATETLPEIDENGLPDYDNDPGFLKRLAEKKELNKRNYNGTWLEATPED